MSSTKNNLTLLQKIQGHPDLLRTLSPREFEELVAALLASFGWHIQNKPKGDDDCDFSAFSEVGPGLPVTWIVQCKFVVTPRPIGVEDLRNLYGAKMGAGASNAMLVTNASFTEGAKNFAASKSDLHLIQYDQIMEWLEKATVSRERATATRAIESAAFAGRFLRIDGNGRFTWDGGGGTVNCQTSVGAWEKFILEPQRDGTFAIASAAFAGRFLRMDGNGPFTSESGGGAVRCQTSVGAWEKFIIEPQRDGTFAIESAAFAGRFLRMDGNGPFTWDGGGGTVNCQTSVGAWEKFRFV